MVEGYAPRTDITYGSSLDPAIHGLVAASLGKTGEAYENFRLAALVDLENTRGNAAEGIHAASCGSIWQAVVFGVAGIQFTKNGPVAKPNLPPTWKRLQFKLYWRGDWYSFDLKPEVSSIKRSKPAPDLFLYTASQLELEPADCLVVEDAASEVEAALAGGMRTIRIGSDERVGAAQIILPNLEGVSFEDIQRKFSFCLAN